MRIDRSLSVQQALELGTALPWALIRSLSEVTLGPAQAATDTNELIEARFFSANEEIRLFRSDGALHAACLIAEPEDCVIEQVCRIQNPVLGGTITVSSTLQADEDGQMNIAYTRLAGWEDVK